MMLQHPDAYTVSYRIRRKDGFYIWFETTSRRVREPGTDEVPEMIAVSRDITQRKRVEEELRESQEALRKSEEFHRFAVEAGRIGTWDLDLLTEECLVSPKMAELMGFPVTRRLCRDLNGGSRSFPKIGPCWPPLSPPLLRMTHPSTWSLGSR